MSLHNCKKELFILLKEKNKFDGREIGKIASWNTQDERKRVLYLALNELFEGGFKIESIFSFREKHATFLIRKWESIGLSAATLQNRTSVLRQFAKWINKSGMIKPLEKYLENPKNGKRCYVAQEDKSWSAKGIDADQVISDIEKYDRATAMHLRLCLVFGLRRKEAIMLKPHRADKGIYLLVSDGTKGGRDRVVPIDNEKKRELIDHAKLMAKYINSSITNGRKTLQQELAHYSYILISRGFNRKELQVTGHGLRHQYLNDRYEELAGHPSPVRGGQETNTYQEEIARLTTSEEAGHSRKSITAAYYGSERMARKMRKLYPPLDPSVD